MADGRGERAARWRRILGLAAALTAASGAQAQAETWAERLGYPAGKKETP